MSSLPFHFTQRYVFPFSWNSCEISHWPSYCSFSHSHPNQSYHMRKYMKNLTWTILFSFSLLARLFTSQTLTREVDDIWIHTWGNKMFLQLSFFWEVMCLVPLQMIPFGPPGEGSLVPMDSSFYYVKVLSGVMFQSFHTCSPIPCKMHVQVKANN
jgi:hypothetical protein